MHGLTSIYSPWWQNLCCLASHPWPSESPGPDSLQQGQGTSLILPVFNPTDCNIYYSTVLAVLLAVFENCNTGPSPVSLTNTVALRIQRAVHWTKRRLSSTVKKRVLTLPSSGAGFLRHFLFLAARKRILRTIMLGLEKISPYPRPSRSKRLACLICLFWTMGVLV
jgi:hypothetical protein